MASSFCKEGTQILIQDILMIVSFVIAAIFASVSVCAMGMLIQRMK